MEKNKILILIFSVLFISSVFYVYNDSKMNMMSDRVDMWKVALNDCFKKPVFGWGLDSFRAIGKEKDFMYFKNWKTGKTEKFMYHEETKSFIPKKGFIGQGEGVDGWDDAHNEYISSLFQFGFVGLTILLLFIRDIYKRFKQFDDWEFIEPIFLMFVVYLIVSIGQFPFHVARLAYLIPIMLGFYYKFTDNEKENKNGQTEGY